MDKNDLLELIRSADELSDCFVFCISAYQFLLEQQSEERPEMLAWFFQSANKQLGGQKNKESLPKELSNRLDDYSYKYKKLIIGLIDFFSIKGYSEEEYYKRLWDSIEALLPDATMEEKGFCLLLCIMDARTPYYELPTYIQLSENQYREVINSIRPSLFELDFAIEVSRGQRENTGLMSCVVQLLEDLDSLNQKSVLLAYFVHSYQKRWGKSKTSEDSGNITGTIQEKEKTSEPSSIEDKNKDTSFLPRKTPRDGEVIANLKHLSMNSDEYDFAIIRREGVVVLSDQGKTLLQLDKIFELTEPDVTKNLNAILKQHGIIKQEDEFVVKIDNWDGNANEDESEELRIGKLTLFACVSFMLNMKIFYV